MVPTEIPYSSNIILYTIWRLSLAKNELTRSMLQHIRHKRPLSMEVEIMQVLHFAYFMPVHIILQFLLIWCTVRLKELHSYSNLHTSNHYGGRVCSEAYFSLV